MRAQWGNFTGVKLVTAERSIQQKVRYSRRSVTAELYDVMARYSRTRAIFIRSCHAALHRNAGRQNTLMVVTDPKLQRKPKLLLAENDVRLQPALLQLLRVPCAIHSTTRKYKTTLRGHQSTELGSWDGRDRRHWTILDPCR